MARVGGPVMMRKTYSLFVENSHPETRHQGVMFRSPWAFVEFTTTLRYEPCTQFINVSQRTLHIYWQFSAMSHAIHKIASKRRCQSYFISRRSPHHGISKDSDLCASAIAVLTMPMHGYAFVTLNLPYFFRNQFCPRHSESGAVCYPLGSNVGHACSIIRNCTVSQNILSQKSY